MNDTRCFRYKRLSATDRLSTTDCLTNISHDKLALRGGYVLTAFLELANTKEKMPFTGNLKDEPGFMPVAASEAEMNMIGLNEDQAGYKVSMIIPDSPAKRSGMKYGDVIISKNGKIFARRNIDDERVFFRDENQPENVWILEIVRNRKKKTLKLQF